MKADGNGLASGSSARCVPPHVGQGQVQGGHLMNSCVGGVLRPDPCCLCRVPTASLWGAVGAVGLVWATDWRLILDWVPYINGKFKKDD